MLKYTQKVKQSYYNNSIVDNLNQAIDELNKSVQDFSDMKDGDIVIINYYVDKEKELVNNIMGIVSVNPNGNKTINIYYSNNNNNFNNDKDLKGKNITEAILWLKQKYDSISQLIS